MRVGTRKSFFGSRQILILEFKPFSFLHLIRVENNMSSNNGLPVDLVNNENSNGQMDLTGLATQLGINAAIAVGVILAFNILRPNHSCKLHRARQLLASVVSLTILDHYQWCMLQS
jgi:hypothetical protein